MRLALVLLLMGPACAAAADIVVAARTLRPKAIIQPEDIALRTGEIEGAYDLTEDVIGLETRVAIYAGRPIRMGDIGPPATVERNQNVALIYTHGTLRIVAEGRALGRGAPGERVRVMNMTSRATLSGVIRNDGAIEIK
jgi:flagella basal body P-ring formation protein FlgA